MNTLTCLKKIICKIIFKLTCFAYPKKDIEHHDLRTQEFWFNKNRSNATDTTKCHNIPKLTCKLTHGPTTSLIYIFWNVNL